MEASQNPAPGSCLAICPVCGSNCKKPYHGEDVAHECPNGHVSKPKEAEWKK